MTREEAISNLASAMDLISGIDHVLWESIEALVTNASPDPDTGLMPCGCGGKAANEDFFDGFFHLSRVTCSKCGIEITTADGQAKVAWNRAMSGGKDNG